MDPDPDQGARTLTKINNKPDFQPFKRAFVTAKSEQHPDRDPHWDPHFLAERILIRIEVKILIRIRSETNSGYRYGAVNFIHSIF